METSAEKKAHYLRLWHKADAILKQPDNPCQIRFDEAGQPSCTASRAGIIKSSKLCCDNCKHLGPQGCTIKCLGCKLAWCYLADNSILGQEFTSHPTYAKIKVLMDEARELKIPMPYHAEPTIKNP